MKRTISNRIVIAIAVSLILATCCANAFSQQAPIQSGYGRSTGRNFTTSVNGTGALKELIRSYGFKVDRYKKISPRLDRYQTVIWPPDDHVAPDEEVIDRIEQWLSVGWERTFIYVGRDYNAEITYWEKMANNASGHDRIEYRRRRARAIANKELTRRFSNDNDDSCPWFDVVDRGDQTSSSLGGPLAADIMQQQTELTFARVLVPPADARYDVEVLLEVNGEPFVYSLSRSSWSGGRIIVVCNGSFLLNLPLVNTQHRVLADNFVNETIQYDPVLFLESTGPIAVSDRDTPNQHNQWTWITHPPLRYIVPQFLFWCVLFCFVYFPIFGRPVKLPKKSTTNFRDHIRAVGQLLERADSETEAKQWITDYHAYTSKHRTKT